MLWVYPETGGAWPSRGRFAPAYSRNAPGSAESCGNISAVATRAREVASSTHPAPALEPAAGCNADPRCIPRQIRAARERPRLRLVSRSATFLLARRRGLSRLLRHDHLLPVFERICGIDHDLVGGGDSAENLQRRAVQC